MRYTYCGQSPNNTLSTLFVYSKFIIFELHSSYTLWLSTCARTIGQYYFIASLRRTPLETRAARTSQRSRVLNINFDRLLSMWYLRRGRFRVIARRSSPFVSSLSCSFSCSSSCASKRLAKEHRETKMGNHKKLRKFRCMLCSRLR